MEFNSPPSLLNVTLSHRSHLGQPPHSSCLSELNSHSVSSAEALDELPILFQLEVSLGHPAGKVCALHLLSAGLRLLGHPWMVCHPHCAMSGVSENTRRRRRRTKKRKSQKHARYPPKMLAPTPPNATHVLHPLPSTGGSPPGFQMMNVCEAGDRSGHHAL